MTDDFQSFIHKENSPLLDGLFSCLNRAPTTSIRYNPNKRTESSSNFDTAGQVPWEPNGFYLDKRPSFITDPGLHQGLYYVQEASSMIYGHIIRHIAHLTGNLPMKVLDSCAAPGGKTTAALAALPPGSAMIANEYDFRRASILRENLDKWGEPSVAVTRGDTARFNSLRGLFNIVMADVPCSGEGMFRKEPQAVHQWSEQLVQQCAERQRTIVENILPSLADGGFLIYSTCTFNTLENEKNVEWFIHNHDLESIPIPVDKDWNVSEAVNSQIHALRFLPQNVKGEGLFVAVLRKKGDSVKSKTEVVSKQKNKAKTITASHNFTNGLILEVIDNIVWGASESLYTLIQNARDKRLGGFLTYGVEIGTFKNNILVPAHQLALTTALNPTAFPSFEVDRETALSFQRRESLTLPDECPKGYVILKYNGLPLGFVKNLGNRANNLLPKEWRVLKNESVLPHGNTPPS